MFPVRLPTVLAQLGSISVDELIFIGYFIGLQDCTFTGILLLPGHSTKGKTIMKTKTINQEPHQLVPGPVSPIIFSVWRN